MSAEIEDIQRGVFNGLLLRDSLKRLEQGGIFVEARASSTGSAPNAEDFSPRLTYEAEKMARVYQSFYCLENAARELIAQRLSERHGPTWWEVKVPRKIKDEVEKIKTKEGKNRYLSTRSASEMGYTYFGALFQIIIANWDDFVDLFPEQSWLGARFADLEMCRNIIMHTNVLPDIEIDRIESILRDWVNQVG